MNRESYTIPGATQQPARSVWTLAVAPAFFTTMEIPMVLGREIGDGDSGTAPYVVVVNEKFAKTYFGNENPIGRVIQKDQTNFEIVGVSRDARYDRLTGEVQPTIYIPMRQRLNVMSRAIFDLRTSGDPLAYVNSVRQTVQRLDSRVPVSNVRTQSSQIEQTISRPVTFARLCTAFAILALLIACVGLYGTVSYGVTRRTNELGIRMALGAQRKRVVWMVLRQVLVMVVGGLAIGLPAAYFSGHLIESFLYEMKPTDPVVLAASVAVMALAALVATYVPARRASRIDPMVALRHE
jgi:predicted permease